MKRQKTEEIYKTITNGKGPAITKYIAGQGEAVQVDGGALVDQPTIDVMSPNFMHNSIYAKCRVMNIDSKRNANGITLPKYDTSSVTDDGFYGVDANWVAEGATLPESNITFTPKVMKLNKVVVNIPVTEELLEDVPAIVGYVNDVGGEAIRYKTDRAIIFGDSAYSMGGVVGSDDASTIYVTEGVSKEATAKTMLASYYGGCEAIWVVSQDVWAELVDEFDGDLALHYEGCQAYLYGYPVYILAAGNDNTMLLGDFSQYQIIQKELRRDISEHVYFDSAQNNIRIIARLQGTPIWSSVMTMANSAISVSPVSNELIGTADTVRAELLETITSGNSGDTASGTATFIPIEAGTFAVDVSGGGYTLADGGVGILSATSLPVTGTVDYDTGDWTIDFSNQEPLTVGTAISAADYDQLLYSISGTLSIASGLSSYNGGSITIDLSSGAHTLTEQEAGLLGTGLASSADIVGTIDEAGAWEIDLGTRLLTNGTTVSATYSVDFPTSSSSTVAPFVALSTMDNGADKY